MSAQRPGALPPSLTPADLAQLLDASPPSGVVVLDGSWHMPATGRDGKNEYNEGPRIPGALFFDVDKIADTASGLPHMLPSEAAFAAAADALGVASVDAPVVVYDGAGIFSAPRVWWTFRAMGHRNIAVLDGGLPAWTAAGLPTEAGAPPAVDAAAAAAAPPAAPRYRARLDPALVRSLTQMQTNVTSGADAVADARPRGRFEGAAPEPRPGLPSGHIPGSASLPASELLVDGRLKPTDELRAALTAAGWAEGGPKKNVATCGSGVTASILAWAAAVAGLDARVAVYDGSWSEWGGRADTPKEGARA